MSEVLVFIEGQFVPPATASANIVMAEGFANYWNAFSPGRCAPVPSWNRAAVWAREPSATHTVRLSAARHQSVPSSSVDNCRRYEPPCVPRTADAATVADAGCHENHADDSRKQDNDHATNNQWSEIDLIGITLRLLGITAGLFR